MKKWLVFFLFFITTSIYSQDIFNELRTRWNATLSGGDTYDIENPHIASRLKDISTNAYELWDSLEKSPSRTFLFQDLEQEAQFGRKKYNTYVNIHEMTTALVTRGSDLYQNENLKTDIIEALDWLYINWYNENSTNTDNWWFYEIGIPRTLVDITTMLYSDLDSTRIHNYMAGIERFSPDPTWQISKNTITTGANRLWKCRIVGLRGILVQDSLKIKMASDAVSPELTYVTSGDGFYRDGSFIQHGKFAYNGGYGIAFLTDIANLFYLFNNSPWSIHQPGSELLRQWVVDGYEPFIYRLGMLDMVKGREISRHAWEEPARGPQCIVAIMRFMQSAPDDIAEHYKAMLKYWLQQDSEQIIMQASPIDLIELSSDIINDENITPRGELITHKQFPNMDRVVHRRPGYVFGISMCSRRIYNYESINNENLKGWYTGNGMTYLYNKDQTAYWEGFWPTVDAYRLPGTTVGTQPRQPGSGHKYAQPNRWVGGVEFHDEDLNCGVAGMEHQAWKTKLKVKKSWFMFDDEIIALGSGITDTNDGNAVETIIENRKISDSGYSFIIDDSVQPFTDGRQYSAQNPQWMYLQHSNPEASIGYYFPAETRVNVLRESRTGSWSDIDGRSNVPTEEIQATYATMWIDHGNTPVDADYAYVLLPGLPVDSVKRYAMNPDVEIIKNSVKVHAVRKKSQNIWGINFWAENAGKVWRVSCDNTASMIIRIDDSGTLSFNISDPTHIIEKQIHVEIDLPGTETLNISDKIEVLQMQPSIKLAVDVNAQKGKTLSAQFKIDPTHVEKANGKVPNFTLFNNYPNPFNPSTNIGYVLSRSTRVNISIYNCLGQLVKVLVDDNQAYGHHEILWDGTDQSQNLVQSGVYFVEMKADHYVERRRILLLR